MTHMITPGRWLGMKACSTDRNVFTILAFDQRGSYHKMLPKDAPFETAVQIKTEVVAALSPHASAVLLDPEYGLVPALHMARCTGLLMSVEESGYTGDSTYRRVEFYSDWDVSKIKAMGASAVKLLVYYHPASGTLASEIEDVVKTVILDCHRHDLPLFLEPLSYSLDANVSKDSAAFAATRREVVIETAHRLGRLGPDVLKMEFPIDAAFNQNQAEWVAACEAISSAVDIPWALLSAGVDFATFEQQARIACQAGASGFLAGRAIWKEVVPMSAEDRAAFIATTCVERISSLAEIANEHARSWTDFYTPVHATQGWYSSYSDIG
jgi:tagatose 1,6-diphosphate aldolase